MIEAEKGGEGAWDLKQAPGGLVDIEFVAQYLQLVHGHDHPGILSTETEAALAAAARAGLLPAAEADILLPALRLYQALTQILRLCVDGPFKPEEAPRGLLDLLARAGELPDFATLDRHVRDTEAAVRASFERLIGKVPAADVARPSSRRDPLHAGGWRRGCRVRPREWWAADTTTPTRPSRPTVAASGDDLLGAGGRGADPSDADGAVDGRRLRLLGGAELDGDHRRSRSRS